MECIIFHCLLLSISRIYKNLNYHVIFPKLQVLKIRDEFPDDGSLERFIENNGKSLKEISIGEIEGCGDDLLNLTIANFCPMLRKLPLELKIIIWEC